MPQPFMIMGTTVRTISKVIAVSTQEGSRNAYQVLGDPGDVVVGGGWAHVESDGSDATGGTIPVVASRPTTSGEGWEVIVVGEAVPQYVKIYARVVG